jgi:hypothetical protein
MDDWRFDDWIRSLAAARPTRRRMAKAIAGVTLAGLFTGLRGGEVAAGICNLNPGNFCRGNEVACGPGGACVCYRYFEGGQVCAAADVRCRSCTTDGDCPGGRLCVRNGPDCCSTRKKGVCARRCA